MAKKEIYDVVVRLTAEVSETKVAEKIFTTAAEGDAVKTQTIIDAFPMYYPKLYQKISDFGREFNKLVGASDDDIEKCEKIYEDGGGLMYAIAGTNVIEKIILAMQMDDPMKVLEAIGTLRKENSGLVQNLINFQERFTKYREDCSTGLEGSVFGVEADEENGVFVFDTNIIDSLSFYVFCIFANISDDYFFVDDYNGNSSAFDNFVDAIEKVTNENFAEFVASYNLVDWVGEYEEYKNVGEILVAAMAGTFEEEEEDS